MRVSVGVGVGVGVGAGVAVVATARQPETRKDAFALGFIFIFVVSGRGRRVGRRVVGGIKHGIAGILHQKRNDKIQSTRWSTKSGRRNTAKKMPITIDLSS